jgi:general nucleoside transport system ATP-binding protein
VGAFLSMQGITRRFPGVLANDHVDLEVESGEVHALLGENGAGKTTLMNILYGLYQPQEGQIRLDGRQVRIESAQVAIRLGIGMVHQHFMLVPVFTVTENIIMGTGSSSPLSMHLDQAKEKIRDLAAEHNLSVDPDAVVWQLSVGMQQRVEIIKALYRGARLLILDEPTAVLTPQETEELFGILRSLARQGTSIVFISHKLNEVTAISDRVTVLRGGRVVATVKTTSTNQRELARLMVGREVLLRVDRPPLEKGQVRLRLDDVWAQGDRGLPAVRGISLEVRAGEILGVAGVSGNGQRELAELIAGLRRATSGRLRLDEHDITAWEPDRRLAHGLAYIPEERMRDGVIRELSVEENLIIEDHGRPPFARGIFLNFARIAQHVDRLIDEFEIKTPSRSTPLRNLSGGNIQKLILARELAKRPSVLVAAQPTRGVDIGSTEYIHRRLIEQRAAGTATLLITEDLDEVLNLSDRVAVLYEGRVMGILDREEATVERLGLMMAGVPLAEALAARS